MEVPELILKYVDTLVWPVVTVFILIYFKNDLSKLFDRAKKIELPGGISIEAFERKLEQAKRLEKEIRAEKLQAAATDRQQETTQDNMKTTDPGSIPSVRRLDVDLYRELAKSDQQLAVAGLRIDLELMIKKLAAGFGLQLKGDESPSKVINLLFEEGYLNLRQAEYINTILQLSSYALRSDRVTPEQIYSLINLSKTFIEGYNTWLDG